MKSIILCVVGIALLALGIILPVVYGQAGQEAVVLLSHRFNQGTISNEVVGEVLNNGTRPLDKYDVNIIASFYDSAGVLVGSDQGFIDAETLGEGDRSAFNVFITDDAIMNEAATYDISINDERVLEGALIDGGGDEQENGSSSNSNGDSDESEE
ncbi:MAG: hypothetical protein GEU26_12820 [Nitrososphaeraceae archaeon]|nr:hypothetical protein [Nitrososphaeraceae archaeon]